MVPSNPKIFLLLIACSTHTFGLHLQHKRDLENSIAQACQYGTWSLNQPIFSRGDEPRLFSHITDLTEAFSSLPRTEANIKKSLKSIVAGLVTQHGQGDAILTSGGEKQGVDQLRTQTAKHLWAVRKLLHHSASETTFLDRNRQKIVELLQPLLPDKPDSISKFSKDLAQYHSDQLQSTQNAIANLIKSRDPRRSSQKSREHFLIQFHKVSPRSPIPRALGLFGPSNLLEMPVIQMLKNPSVRTAFKLPKLFTPSDFTRHVYLLNDHFKPLIESLDLRHPAQEEQVTGVISKINEIYENLERGFQGEGGGLLGLISNIEASELVKSFRRDYTNPINTAGEELALTQPWGFGRNENHLLSGEFPGAALGLSDGSEAHKALVNLQHYAWENTNKRLKTAIAARQLIAQLLELYTPAGLDALAGNLKGLHDRPRNWGST